MPLGRITAQWRFTIRLCSRGCCQDPTYCERGGSLSYHLRECAAVRQNSVASCVAVPLPL